MFNLINNLSQVDAQRFHYNRFQCVVSLTTPNEPRERRAGITTMTMTTIKSYHQENEYAYTKERRKYKENERPIGLKRNKRGARRKNREQRLF